MHFFQPLTTLLLEKFMMHYDRAVVHAHVHVHAHAHAPTPGHAHASITPPRVASLPLGVRLLVGLARANGGLVHSPSINRPKLPCFFLLPFYFLPSNQSFSLKSDGATITRTSSLGSH